MSAAFESLIARRAEFLWQNLLQSGCIDFPRADVKLAIKAIREESPAGDTGILDGLKTLIVSKLFARSYVPRLRLKIMDKLVIKFTREISILFVAVWAIFLRPCFYGPISRPAFSPLRPMRPRSSYSWSTSRCGAQSSRCSTIWHLVHTIWPSAGARLFIAHTLVFRLFMSLFVIATFLKVLKLLLRRHALAG